MNEFLRRDFHRSHPLRFDQMLQLLSSYWVFHLIIGLTDVVIAHQPSSFIPCIRTSQKCSMRSEIVIRVGAEGATCCRSLFTSQIFSSSMSL
jgi:hypothetical protein